MRGFSTFTSNDGPGDVFETLATFGWSGRDTNQTMDAMPVSKTSAMMISDVFMDCFNRLSGHHPVKLPHLRPVPGRY